MHPTWAGDLFSFMFILSVFHINNVEIICPGNLYMGHAFPSSIPCLTALMSIIIQGKTMAKSRDSNLSPLMLIFCATLAMSLLSQITSLDNRIS